jgi:hypothetical protein
MKHRLLVVAGGLLLVFAGFYKFSHGPFLGMNSRHQPVYSTDLIGIGALVVAFGLVPTSWLDRMAKPAGSKSVVRADPQVEAVTRLKRVGLISDHSTKALLRAIIAVPTDSIHKSRHCLPKYSKLFR